MDDLGFFTPNQNTEICAIVTLMDDVIMRCRGLGLEIAAINALYLQADIKCAVLQRDSQ